MNEINRVPPGHPWIAVLRWLAVLPAALVASWCFRGVGQVLPSLLGDGLRESEIGGNLVLWQQLLPSGAAFTVGGALLAPRRKLATAVVLAVVCILLSVVIHIIGQPNPGRTNHLHFAGESVGAILGAGAVCYVVGRRGNRTPTSAGES